VNLGAWQRRQMQRRARHLDQFAAFIERRALEVGFNGAVLYRELQGLGFTGGIVQVQRWLRLQRERVSGRRWRRCASRPGRASRPRSITVSCGSGLGRSQRKFIYSCSRWAIRACLQRFKNDPLAALKVSHPGPRLRHEARHARRSRRTRMLRMAHF
jgi:hypothetical protein